MADTGVKPRYAHDCDACRFLGTIDKYDLWYCERCDDGSAIARYSSEPSEYASRGFMRGHIAAVRRETGGLTEDETIVLATFRAMPSLLLNIWGRS
jgi:hypothetical protein